MTRGQLLPWVALLGALAAACTFGDDGGQSRRTYTYTATPTPTAYLGDLDALLAADASLGLVVETALDGDPEALLALFWREQVACAYPGMEYKGAYDTCEAAGTEPGETFSAIWHCSIVCFQSSELRYRAAYEPIVTAGLRLEAIWEWSASEVGYSPEPYERPDRRFAVPFSGGSVDLDGCQVWACDATLDGLLLFVASGAETPVAFSFFTRIEWTAWDELPSLGQPGLRWLPRYDAGRRGPG